MPVNLINEGDLNKYLTSIVFTNGEVPHWVSESKGESQKNLQSPDWVEEHRDEVVKAILLQYFKKRIRSYITKDEKPEDERRKFFLRVNNSIYPGLPEWAKKAIKEGKKVFMFDAENVSPELKEKLTSIRDFLYDKAYKYVLQVINLAKETDKISKIRLDYLKSSNEFADFDDVLTYANLWHEKLAKNASKVRRDEAFYKKSLEGTKFVMDLPDDLRAYRLLTPEALDFEGKNMGNCVGQGYYDEGVKEGTTEIYSIRDITGMSHITFEIRENSIYQCKGKENKRPVDKYVPAIAELIKKKKWYIDDCDGLNGIVIFINDEMYYTKDLIDGKIKLPNVIDNSINLSGIDLKKLPDFSNCVVNGNFDCSFNQLTSLEGAPKEVDGSFYCSSNQLTSLEGAPQEVGGYFYCSNNQLTNLKGAPKEVGGKFDCSYNKLTTLEGAPKEVGGDFYCYDNQLTSLEGAPYKVGDSFDCSFNQLTSLEGAPNIVAEDFNCRNNQLTSLEGAPNIVAGDFNCSDNKLTSLKGAPKKVGGFFGCSNNQLTSLDGRPKASRYIFDNNPLQRCGNERE